MCGRFVQRYTWDEVQDLYELPDGPARNLQAHYNIAPTDPERHVATLTHVTSAWHQSRASAAFACRIYNIALG